MRVSGSVYDFGIRKGPSLTSVSLVCKTVSCSAAWSSSYLFTCPRCEDLCLKALLMTETSLSITTEVNDKFPLDHGCWIFDLNLEAIFATANTRILLYFTFNETIYS